MAFFARPQSRSAAVKIVAPPSADANTASSASGPSLANGESSGAAGGTLGASTGVNKVTQEKKGAVGSLIELVYLSY